MANRNDSADWLIAFLKRTTRQSDGISPSGAAVESLNTDDLLQFLNEGKRLIQWGVANACPSAFRAFVVEPITERLLEFPLPVVCLFGDRVFRIDYSEVDDPARYYSLKKGDASRINYGDTGSASPSTYYLNGGNAVIETAPNAGFYRFLIQREDDKLDVRRGVVVEPANVSGDNLVSIKLDVASAKNNNINQAALSAAEWICVCDFEGEVGLYNIPISGYDVATGVLTVRGTFPYTSGINVGDFVTIGKYSSTHSKLPSGFQDYFLTYAKYRCLNWDSNSDKIEEIPVLQTMKSALIEGIADNIGEEPILESGPVTGNWFGPNF